jgi:hypothetical protein
VLRSCSDTRARERLIDSQIVWFLINETKQGMALPNMVAEKRASQERVKYYGLWISEVHEIDGDDHGVNVVPVTGN